MHVDALRNDIRLSLIEAGWTQVAAGDIADNLEDFLEQCNRYMCRSEILEIFSDLAKHLKE